jgi:hypothetical protein
MMDQAFKNNTRQGHGPVRDRWSLYYPLPQSLKGHLYEKCCLWVFFIKPLSPPDSDFKAVSNISSNSPRYSNS